MTELISIKYQTCIIKRGVILPQLERNKNMGTLFLTFPVHDGTLDDGGRGQLCQKDTYAFFI